jgi:hypothetical protein
MTWSRFFDAYEPMHALVAEQSGTSWFDALSLPSKHDPGGSDLPQRTPIVSVSPSEMNPRAADAAVRLCRPLERHPTQGVRLFLQTIQGQREQSRAMAMRGQRIAGGFKCGDVRQNDSQWGHSVRLASTAVACIAIAVTDQSFGTTSDDHGPGGRVAAADGRSGGPIGWLNGVPRTASPTVRHSPGNTSYSAAVESSHRVLTGRVRPNYCYTTGCNASREAAARGM